MRRARQTVGFTTEEWLAIQQEASRQGAEGAPLIRMVVLAWLRGASLPLSQEQLSANKQTALVAPKATQSKPKAAPEPPRWAPGMDLPAGLRWGQGQPSGYCVESFLDGWPVWQDLHTGEIWLKD